MLVAEAAASTLLKGLFNACGIQIQQDLAACLIAHHGARRHLDDHVCAVLAGSAAAGAVLAVSGGELAMVAEIHQRVHAIGCREDYIAAASAVAAVRTTGHDVFLAMEGYAAVAAVACLRSNAYNINK